MKSIKQYAAKSGMNSSGTVEKIYNLVVKV